MINTLRTSRVQLITILFTMLLGFTLAHAGGISPELQVKIDIYKTKLTEWAKDPVIVKAVLQANSNKANMDNKTWKPLATSNSKVKAYLTNPAGMKLLTWDNDKSLGKLFLRDKKGNLVAGSKKPAIFNIADRPAFTKAIRGKVWNSKKVKADPTTKLSSIQLSIPVKNNGKEIGILHTSIIAN